MLPVPLIVGGVGLAALVGFAMTEDGTTHPREIWLINGKTYVVSHRIHGAGWDASMYPGFCSFSEPVITGQGGTGQTSYTEVQFKANWCMQNTLWQVPPELAIAEA